MLAKKLGAKVIIEGIETSKQLDLLKKTGCHVGQGYLFGKPGPIDVVSELIGEVNQSWGGAFCSAESRKFSTI